MNRTLHRSAVRGGVVAALAAGAALLTAGPASAHVTAQPGEVAAGGSAVVSFRVPDESDTAGTVKLEVALPTDHPITSVRTTPIPGWTAAVTKATLNPPVQVDGNAVTQAVGAVTWTANPGTRIGPGEYLDFPLSLGPLPTGVDQLALPATQTYDDGTVVAWNQPPTGGEEPEHPAPVVRLAPATGADAMAGPRAGVAPPPSATDETARWMAGAGLLVGALGVGVGVGAVLRGRRAGAR
jgi:periplasmic copper chaperone A